MSSEFKKIFKVLDSSKIQLSEDFITIEQYYLNFYPRVRYRNHAGNCTMTLKVITGNNEKVEHAIPVSKEEYALLKANRVTKLMQKNRHCAKFGDEIGIYDVYFGDLYGIEILSMEFRSRKEMNNFKVPDFLEETGDVITVEELTI